MTLQVEQAIESGRGQATDIADARIEDLADLISAYHGATEKLRTSHEVLGAEVVRLQQQLASTDAQLQRSRRLAALGEMAAGIAHEIRNPLAAIGLYARMIVDDLNLLAGADVDNGVVNAERNTAFTAADNAEKIAAAVHGLNAIVTDVLSFARELDPKPASLRADELFDRAIEAHRPAIDAGRVQVRQSGAPTVIRADPDLLHQAILNLIRNAVDAMAPAGGILTLDAVAENGQSVITVRDTGPGIAEQAVDRIFNPFFTTRNTGTGLGLAIVHRIIDAHGGAISVTNNAGAVFRLSLPHTAAPCSPVDSGVRR
jgi:two-component system sensor histidine kinase HydH